VQEALDDVQLLIYLGRKNSEVSAAVMKLIDGIQKRLVKVGDLAFQHLGKAQQNGTPDFASRQLADDVIHIDLEMGVLGRGDGEVASLVDLKVSGAPVFDTVQLGNQVRCFGTGH